VCGDGSHATHGEPTRATSFESSTTMNLQSRTAAHDLMLERIYGEFLEMPGLRLTTEQAQRLWGLDAQTCRYVLDVLIEARFLYCPSHGVYTRTSDGSVPGPRLKMAKAGFCDSPSV
jgi:hypothetical protein